VGRRNDNRRPERDRTRINERIRATELRLIDETGKQLGIVTRDEALRTAEERDFDLVEISANAKPPVCRLLNYSKYRYEQEQKAKAARKNQQQIIVHEIKLRPKIADHDFQTKRNHVKRFLAKGNKVKVTIMFRGREQTHPALGRALLDRLVVELDGLATVEQSVRHEGRNMTMILSSTTAVPSGPGSRQDAQ
jgi:translation initiation factor IF-3